MPLFNLPRPAPASQRPKGPVCKAASLKLLDLTKHPIQDVPGVLRAQGGFRSETPWLKVGFGDVALAPGFWTLRCQGDIAELAVFLRSDMDPLVTLAGRDAGRHLIFVRETTHWDVEVLIGAWPGFYEISRLELVRLTYSEAGRLLLSVLSRALTRGGFLKRLLALGKRLRSGQAMGLALAGSPGSSDQKAFKSVPIANEPGQASRLSARIERHDQAVIRLEADERLHPEAMSIVNREFGRNPDLLAIYSDAWVDGLIAPVPAWDPELLEGGVFPDAPVFLRAGTPVSIDGVNRALGDILREVGPSRSSRISLPLVRGDKPRTRPKSVAMIRRAVGRPLVSAVIPTRYRPDLLDRCLGGLSRQTDYPNLEVIIVDNGSTDLRYEALYKQYTQCLDLRVLRVEEAFNYSRLVNRGVREASGGIIMSLNDDVEAMDPGWLESLVDSALRPEIGVVGCRLLYGDGTLQHGGVTFGIGGVAAHLWKGVSPEEAADNPMVIYPSRRRAVTGACMAFRRNAFDMVCGFDESFAVAFNDLDFCLRLEARGLGVLYRGDVILTHHESQSRGADDASVARRRRLAKEIALFRERWGVFRSDPYGSQAFDPTRDSGAVYDWLAADWPVRRGTHRSGPVLRDSPKDFSDSPVADPRI